ncbi:MAG: SDR family NAD(P)-dependent oxidoreductase [Deltaproteobacteria bacterium]|nr:SDR family NAD(P)-dependent oxidoreductase [Deltaproteobacteria bacterium]
MSATSRSALVSGVRGGLGQALAARLLDQGVQVVGLSRNRPSAPLGDHPDFDFVSVDLSDLPRLEERLSAVLTGRRFELAILNAGVFGKLAPLADTSIERLRAIMDLNVWANKLLIDLLLRVAEVDQLIAISSAAAVNGSGGWGGYAISKAALNLLMRCFADEHPQTHFVAVAPGIIDTPMLREILAHRPDARYPALARVRAAQQAGQVLSPEAAARRLLDARERLAALPSGSYADIRRLSSR